MVYSYYSIVILYYWLILIIHVLCLYYVYIFIHFIFIILYYRFIIVIVVIVFTYWLCASPLDSRANRATPCRAQPSPVRPFFPWLFGLLMAGSQNETPGPSVSAPPPEPWTMQDPHATMPRPKLEIAGVWPEDYH